MVHERRFVAKSGPPERAQAVVKGEVGETDLASFGSGHSRRPLITRVGAKIAQRMDGHLCLEPLDDGAFARASAVCMGAGRFMRAVLVPALRELGCEVVLAQTRGHTFCDYMAARSDRSYEIDSVMPDGTVGTTRCAVAACGSLGVPQGRAAFLALPSKLSCLRYIGVGLTEAGLVHNGDSINHLAALLHACSMTRRAGGNSRVLSVINTDNVPWNGNALRAFVSSCDFTRGIPPLEAEPFAEWLRDHVVFHNTVVDRITSHRPNAPEVPRAEPLPRKTLVIEDARRVLPDTFGTVRGVHVRTRDGEIGLDLQLKLRACPPLPSLRTSTSC